MWTSNEIADRAQLVRILLDMRGGGLVLPKITAFLLRTSWLLVQDGLILPEKCQWSFTTVRSASGDILKQKSLVREQVVKAIQ